MTLHSSKATTLKLKNIFAYQLKKIQRWYSLTKNWLTDLKKSLPCFINSIQLSFTEKTPNGLLCIIRILCNIYPELLCPFFKPINKSCPFQTISHSQIFTVLSLDNEKVIPINPYYNIKLNRQFPFYFTKIKLISPLILNYILLHRLLTSPHFLIQTKIKERRISTYQDSKVIALFAKDLFTS